MKALIMADQPLVDIGLRIALFRAMPTVKVLSCRSAAAAIGVCARVYVSLLVLDLDTQHSRRLSCAKKLQLLQHDAKLLAVTARPDALERHHARKTGVAAYLPKSADTDELCVAVQYALKSAN